MLALGAALAAGGLTLACPGAATAVPTATASGAAAQAPAAASASSGEAKRLLVLAREGAGEDAVRAAVRAAGGTVTDANTDVGLYTVRPGSAGFAAAVTDSAAVVGVTPDRVIGHAPHDGPKHTERLEKALADRTAAARKDLARHRGAGKGPERSQQHRGRGHGQHGHHPQQPAPEPLAGLQWDMDMIHAPAAHATETGRGVRVGIIDTGVDASHPDIAAHFDHRLSRNFTVDDPAIDGPCADDPDGKCTDPADVDEDGHGTHVASTIAAPVNGVGIAGVAPDADIVNLRAGQDSGYFFLAATVDALTYAGDHGIDVVNMSYYIDPWLFNCADNPADTPAQQEQQRTIIAATNRALRYARHRGVTLVSAAGNENTDLDDPTTDTTSPDYPPGSAHDRTVDNSCLSMPTEGSGVIAVSSVGPSTLKAYYSNWGTQEVSVAAPGGAYRDGYGTPAYATPGNLVLAAMPKALALDSGEVNAATGVSTSPFIVSQCPTGKDSCEYWQYLQGTSMASPHAAGVAALAVGAHGHRDRRGHRDSGLTLNPWRTEQVLTRTATETACPAPVYDYPDLPDSFTSNCDGTKRFNGWYGHGIVDALGAVEHGHHRHHGRH